MADIDVTDLNFSNAFNSRSVLILNNKKHTEFWLKSVTLPSMDVAPEDIDMQPHKLRFPGNVMVFGDFSITVFIDENFKVYEELYNWLTMAMPNETAWEDNQLSGMILILNNQLTAPIAKFKFTNMQLSTIPALTYTNFGTEQLSVDLSIAYDRFEPEFLE